MSATKYCKYKSYRLDFIKTDQKERQILLIERDLEGEYEDKGLYIRPGSLMSLLKPDYCSRTDAIETLKKHVIDNHIKGIERLENIIKQMRETVSDLKEDRYWCESELDLKNGQFNGVNKIDSTHYTKKVLKFR
jgi:hypothetical protein